MQTVAMRRSTNTTVGSRHCSQPPFQVQAYPSRRAYVQLVDLRVQLGAGPVKAFSHGEVLLARDREGLPVTRAARRGALVLNEARATPLIDLRVEVVFTAVVAGVRHGEVLRARDREGLRISRASRGEAQTNNYQYISYAIKI